VIFNLPLGLMFIVPAVVLDTLVACFLTVGLYKNSKLFWPAKFTQNTPSQVHSNLLGFASMEMCVPLLKFICYCLTRVSCSGLLQDWWHRMSCLRFLPPSIIYIIVLKNHHNDDWTVDAQLEKVRPRSRRFFYVFNVYVVHISCTAARR
jgi:hypothetical protein